MMPTRSIASKGSSLLRLIATYLTTPIEILLIDGELGGASILKVISPLLLSTQVKAWEANQTGVRQASWYRVVATDMERVTTSQALYSQPYPLQKAIPDNSLAGILRTGWGKTAGWRHNL